MDDLCVRGKLRDLAGHAVREARAHGDEQVALHNGHVCVLRAVHANRSQVVLVRAGHGTLAHERGHHGDVHGLGELDQLLAGVAGHNAAAGVNERALGLHDELRGLLDLPRVAAVGGLVAGDANGVRVVEDHLRAGEVAGDVDEDGARAAGGGDVERLAEGACEVVGGLQQERVLHDGHGDAHDVRLLERVGANDAARDLAGDDHQGHGVHVGGHDARHGVGGAGARGDENNAHLARGAGIAVGHVGCALLVPGQHVVDALGVIERVVDLDCLAAGVAKDRVDALALQACDDRLGAGHGLALVLRVGAHAKGLALDGRLLAGELLCDGRRVAVGVRHDRYAPLSALVTSLA